MFYKADGGGQEDKVGPQQVLHQRQRDGSRLIHAHQLRLAQLHTVTGVDVLQGVHTLLLGWMYCKAYTVTGWMYCKAHTHCYWGGCTARVHTHCYWDGCTARHTQLLGGCTARGIHTHYSWVMDRNGYIHTVTGWMYCKGDIHCYWVREHGDLN